jgi:hypothetical protein
MSGWRVLLFADGAGNLLHFAVAEINFAGARFFPVVIGQIAGLVAK